MPQRWLRVRTTKVRRAYARTSPQIITALMFAILTETNCISSAAPKVESIGRRR
jgi:hypothetical protein